MLKFNSKPVAEHSEVPLGDDGQLEKLVARFNDREEAPAGPEGAVCYVVSVGPERDPVARAAQLAEIVSLVQHQGGQVVGQEIVRLTRPHARTLLGTGTAQAIAERARAQGATLLVLDAELTPSQTRNLEDALGMPLCDREAVILNVFLRHARTRRARIQVEIAQLEYLRPRIRGLGLDMDQQTGGNKYARGPGETASELMARKLDGRLKQLKLALESCEKSGQVQRQQRSSAQRVALVGYTNAGKTSLMNALTRAELSARDMPFETLDTTSRCLTRHGSEIVLSDTVGFIRRLPERLLASFHSTLSEISEASLLLIVVDVSDPERELQLETTLRLIEQIGAQDVPRFYVFNKLDRSTAPPEPNELAALCDGHPWQMLSAHDAPAVALLQQRLIEQVRSREEQDTLFIPYGRSNQLSLIYANCRVLGSEAGDAGLKLQVQASPAVMARLRGSLKGVH
ncbi:MAG: GTPase HflX [Myxococcota bacterium]|jgi:GTPase|nr:GTPase HflX [Myxococcota bacterium]